MIIELLSRYREVSESLPHNVAQRSSTHGQYNPGLEVWRRPKDFHEDILFCIKIMPDKELLSKAVKGVKNCDLSDSQVKHLEIVEIALIVKDNYLESDGGKISAYDVFEINDEPVYRKNYKVDVHLEALQQIESGTVTVEKMKEPVFSLLLVKK